MASAAADGSAPSFGGSGSRGAVELGAVDLEPELVDAIAQAARRAGLTVAAWYRRAYEEQLRREDP